MIIDLHSHTRFSFDSTDEPEKLVLKMIEKGVQVFGITDHNYGIKGREKEYIDTINALKNKYRDSIDLYCGVEIATVPRFVSNLIRDVSAYDYCIIEQLDCDDNLLGADLFEYVKVWE